MKKLGIISISFIALVLGLASCGNNTQGGKKGQDKVEIKSVDLKTEVDSLSYAMGAHEAEQMRTLPPMYGGITTENPESFMQGVYDAVYSSEERDEDYQKGHQIGTHIKKSLNKPFPLPGDTIDINIDAFVAGMNDIFVSNSEGKMTAVEAGELIQAIIDRQLKKAYTKEVEEEKAFLAENKTKEGVMETPSGLQYKIIKKGTGEIPGANQTVKAHYTGTFLDGTKFDSSVDRGEPLEFNTSGGVIKAWQEAVQMMPVGSKWIIYAPSEIAYGSQGKGNIKPFTPLVFEIELLEIVDPAKPVK